MTVTVSPSRATSVGRPRTPVTGSIVAPAPVTAKPRPSPAKAAAAATLTASAPFSTLMSASTSTTTGAARTTRTGAGSAESAPEAFSAVTRQVISWPSSAGCGR